MLVGQTQLIKNDGGPVSPKATAVEPNVKQPVSFVVGFFGRCIDEIPLFGVVSLDADLCFQYPYPIQSEDLDTFGEIE